MSWCLLAALGVGPAARAFAQDSTETEKTAAPEKTDAQKKRKKAKRKAPAAAAAAKSEKEPEKPKDAAPVTETTVIEPNLVYRIGKLWPRAGSVYHKPEHGDYFDQIYLTLKFQKTWNYAHTIVVEPGFRTKRENPSAWDDLHHLEQAYVESAATDRLTLTAGKKTEYEGSGFIVNPSDLLNEDKDVLDQIYQKEGVVFTRVRVRMPGDFTLGVGFIPLASAPTNKGRGLLQLAGEVKQVEVRLNVTEHETDKSTTGLSLQRFVGERFEVHFDGRYQTRQRNPDTEGNQYLEYSQYTSHDPKVKDDASGYYLGGTRFIITPRRTFVLELIQQQAGLLPDDFAKYFGALRDEHAKGFGAKNPPTRLLGRHYVFTSLQDDETLPSTHLSANYLLNTDDKSAFVVLAARYAMSPLTSVELSPTYFRGSVDTEFGEMPFAQAYYMIFRGRF